MAQKVTATTHFADAHVGTYGVTFSVAKLTIFKLLRK